MAKKSVKICIRQSKRNSDYYVVSGLKKRVMVMDINRAKEIAGARKRLAIKKGLKVRSC